MEAEQDRVVSLPAEAGPAEERMLREDLVREMVARKERGEGVKRIARELGIDRKTVKRWLMLGDWQPRRVRQLPRPIDRFAEFIEQRVVEVGWNGVVLHRELVGLGFTGTYQQVQRYLKPLRAKRRWSQLATVRFETEPGEQAQVDYGQLRVWIGEQPETVHLFVFTLGIRAACSHAGIATKDSRRCSMTTSARCATLAESPLPVSMIIRVPW